MTEPKRSKRVKPDPELLKLADALAGQLPETPQGQNGQKHSKIPFGAIGCICDFPPVLRQLKKVNLRNQTKENCCFFEHLLSKIVFHESP